jgi:hypothetical protein
MSVGNGSKPRPEITYLAHRSELDGDGSAVFDQRVALLVIVAMWAIAETSWGVNGNREDSQLSRAPVERG